MKKLNWPGVFVFSAAALFFVLSMMACGQTPSLDVEQLWSQEDVLRTGELVNSMGGLLVTRQVTLHMKPPFYKGIMPLVYETASKEMGGGGFGSSLSIPAMHDFGGWRNLFIYKDVQSLALRMPAGAVAVDNKSNNIIAECKVKQLLMGDKQLSGFEIAEIHYSQDGRRAIFTSTFVVDFPRGFKTKEKETMGKKEKDYFFIWPSGLGGF